MEKYLLNAYRKATPEQRRLIMIYVQTLTRNNPDEKPTESEQLRDVIIDRLHRASLDKLRFLYRFVARYIA